MIDETVVNVLRRRNQTVEIRQNSEKWRQTVATVDWLTTQIPPESRFQIYAFNTKSSSVVPDKAAQWLDGGDREVLNEAVARVRGIIPKGARTSIRLLLRSGLSGPPPTIFTC